MRKKEITKKILIELTKGLADNEWAEWAGRVYDLDPVLGTFQCLHAESADWSSPPLKDWPGLAWHEYQEIEAETEEEAEEEWHQRYSVPYSE